MATDVIPQHLTGFCQVRADTADEDRGRAQCEGSRQNRLQLPIPSEFLGLLGKI